MAVINNIKINSNFQHWCNYAEQRPEGHWSPTFNVYEEKQPCALWSLYVLADEDHKEGRDKVIYPLNISAGRMTYGPYEQYPLKNLKEK